MQDQFLIGIVPALVGLAAAVFLLLVVLRLWQSAPSSGNPPNGNSPATAAPRKEPPPARPLRPIDDAPFGIARRPLPAGTDLDVLLPKQVGSFHRVSVREMDENWHYATYRSGAAEVFVELSVSDVPEGAQQALSNARRETMAEFPDVPRQESTGTEPSFLAATTRLGAFVAWTRDRYYFSAHAKGGDADMDAFQAAFPY